MSVCISISKSHLHSYPLTWKAVKTVLRLTQMNVPLKDINFYVNNLWCHNSLTSPPQPHNPNPTQLPSNKPPHPTLKNSIITPF